MVHPGPWISWFILDLGDWAGGTATGTKTLAPSWPSITLQVAVDHLLVSLMKMFGIFL